jgi:hypothetical protein
VQGKVVDSKKSGALAGRGELTLQLTQVTLGGVSTPIVSDVWGRTTGDKAVQSVNNTATGGAIGALFGAVAGGGRGAAIGAGVGGALGLGSAAASGGGQVYVPSEGVSGGDGPAGAGSSSGSTATATPAALSNRLLRAGLLSALSLSLWLSLSVLK